MTPLNLMGLAAFSALLLGCSPAATMEQKLVKSCLKNSEKRSGSSEESQGLCQCMAKEMIRLSGFEPEKDIPITFTGIRPGEKLFEEYMTAEEGVDSTRHEKIFVAKISGESRGDFSQLMRDLQEATDEADDECLRKLFKEMVPSYEADAPRSDQGVESKA